MSRLSDAMYIKDLELNIYKHIKRDRIVDDMMDEILILDNPEAMREIALFVKEVLRGK